MYLRSTPIKQGPTDNPIELGVYRSDTIEACSEVALTKGGLILIALLAGGDCSNGVCGCGEAVAHGLAKCGFGDVLYETCMALDGIERRAFISTWLVGVCNELQTNSRNDSSAVEAESSAMGARRGGGVIDLTLEGSPETVTLDEVADCENGPNYTSDAEIAYVHRVFGRV